MTRKPNFKDKAMGVVNWFIFIASSFTKGDVGNCKFGWAMLLETMRGRFEVVVKEKKQ